jgi:uncharacterized protein
MITDPRPTVAVVGSGVAGLTAAHLLQQRYDVHLFEADERPGGHAHTHDVALTSGRVAGLDTAFLVHNTRTYPTLLRLFGELDVATQDTEMSMSVRCDGCGLEYAGGKGPRGLVPRASALTRPRYVAMLAQARRFHRRARALLASRDDDISLGEFLRRERFGRYAAHHLVLPLVAAVWSCGFDGARAYPARYLFEFLRHHGALAVAGSPQWRTVSGGSRTYVERIAKQLTGVHTATPVRAVTRHADGVAIRDDADDVRTVDRVVVATHPDQALRLLTDPTPDEHRLLGAFRYLPSEAILHTDGSVLPRAPRARASWNYRMASCDSDDRRVRISYDIKRLQRIEDDADYVVTLNDSASIDPGAVLATMTYAHPTYTRGSVAAQRELPVLNHDRTAFAGAWHGWGFHEDGCVAGLRAAESFGAGWRAS